MNPSPSLRAHGRSWFALLSRILGFGGISAVGLGVDCILFTALVVAGLPPAGANLISATVAVTMVFAFSLRRIFAYQGVAVWPRYLAYIAYHCVAVVAASLAIGLLVERLSFAPLAAKLALLPVTFAANYLMLALLTRPAANHQ